MQPGLEELGWGGGRAQRGHGEGHPGQGRAACHEAPGPSVQGLQLVQRDVGRAAPWASSLSTRRGGLQSCASLPGFLSLESLISQDRLVLCHCLQGQLRSVYGDPGPECPGQHWLSPSWLPLPP